MTREQIIQETIYIYKNPENRSVDENGVYCLYKGPNNKLCAYARIIKPEYRNLLIEISGAEDQPDLGKVKNPYIEGYGGKSMAFYSFIQDLHDTLFEEDSIDNIKKAKNPKDQIDIWVRINGKALPQKLRSFTVEAVYKAIFPQH